MSGIYDDPKLYQLACAYRDIPSEVDALLAWLAGMYLRGAPRQPRACRVLELAAAPADHARESARRGLSATALDINPVMCACAQEEAEPRGPAGFDVVEADMRDFKLPVQADLAITMLNSALPPVHAGRHGQRTWPPSAAHVVPGGLYILELAHPADYLSAASPYQ